MTPLNTIIEEEKEGFEKLEYIIGDINGYEPDGEIDTLCSQAQREINKLKESLTTAMQRAYEAGAEERDTYWKERVGKELASVCAKIDAKIIQRYRGFALDAGEVGFNDGLRRAKQIITNEDNLK